jgi:hypothetical protein
MAHGSCVSDRSVCAPLGQGKEHHKSPAEQLPQPQPDTGKLNIRTSFGARGDARASILTALEQLT